MANIFTNYVSNLDRTSVLNASDWFNNKTQQTQELIFTRETANDVKKVDTSRIIKDNSVRAVSRIRLGHLYLFRYDPKHKATLPYYDIFPIIFVIQKTQQGFLGLNMHYLPYEYRAKLMDALYTFVTGEDDFKKLRATYKILSTTTKLRYYKPCLKHYLNTNIKSRFLHVDPSEWDTAVFLPLQKFIKAPVQQVHRDSVRMIRRNSSIGQRR